MSSPLLINEPPLQVLPSLAKAIGLNEAIVLQQLHYWLQNKHAGIEHRGKRWVYNTHEEWQEQFPFWSTRTIMRTFQSLKDKGLVISKQIAKGSWNRTMYYSIDYDKLNASMVTSCHLPPRHSVTITTETTTETTQTDDQRVEARDETTGSLTNTAPSTVRSGIPDYSVEVENILVEADADPARAHWRKALEEMERRNAGKINHRNPWRLKILRGWITVRSSAPLAPLPEKPAPAPERRPWEGMKLQQVKPQGASL